MSPSAAYPAPAAAANGKCKEPGIHDVTGYPHSASDAAFGGSAEGSRRYSLAALRHNTFARCSGAIRS